MAKTITGKLEGVNDAGVKVDGTWYNYSKFGNGQRLSVSDLGATVELEVDKAGFVRSFTITAPKEPKNGNSAPTPRTATVNPRSYALHLAIQCLPYLELGNEDRTESIIVEVLTLAQNFARFLEDDE